MATTKDPNATFEPAALKSLSAFAHHCDTQRPKLLVPVFPQLPTRGCATADAKFTRSRRRPGLSCRWAATAAPSSRRSNARGSASLYTNARNVAGEVAARDGAVIWSAARFRAGYTQGDGFRVHTIMTFTKNLQRTTQSDSLIAGAQFGGCADEPGGWSAPLRPPRHRRAAARRAPRPLTACDAALVGHAHAVVVDEPTGSLPRSRLTPALS